MRQSDSFSPVTQNFSSDRSSCRPVIGVAGGSGSGKTMLVDALVSKADCSITVLPQDLYYRDLSHTTFEDRKRVNFDCPDAVEFDLMAEHIEELAAGRSVRTPIYDFHNHVRTGDRLLSPSDLLVVEGTLILSVEEIASRLDWSVFIDAPSDLRLARRIERDCRERGRSPEDTRRQYEEIVLPMYESWIEPIKETADLIVDGSLSKNEIIDIFQKECLLFIQSKKVD